MIVFKNEKKCTKINYIIQSNIKSKYIQNFLSRFDVLEISENRVSLIEKINILVR